MLSIEWTASSGWLAPRITPYQNLSLDPATCVFHYGFECFEGMKAYRAADDSIRLFRPDKNMARFNSSATRIALPTFDGDQLISLIKKLVKLDERFIPQYAPSTPSLYPTPQTSHQQLTHPPSSRGFSLYIRPTLIGTQRTLGVGPPGSALLYVICSPVGPYYPTGFKAVSLEATTSAVRAWPGGAGDKKIGANYVPCIVPQVEAAGRGFHQNLWMFGPDDQPTEAGTMNLFVVFRDPVTGGKELVTPPLDGTILPGVTRDSVLGLARERLVPKGWKVSERHMTMRELADKAERGELVEAFGSGTAAVVSPIRNISWRGRNVDCGLSEEQEAGETALMMSKWVQSIQYGDEDSEWSVVV
ncbi:hypothetical protein MMC10_004924 [Thelotrema lepadinum]|nr:hypothetical protein [Thelotrema lepadinum]